jgi:Zn2+/Cd2+-exporting ATPase
MCNSEANMTDKTQAMLGVPLEPVSARFSIDGMDCTSCAAKIERAVGKLDGVSATKLLFGAERLEVSFDPARISTDGIAGTVRKLGYGATSLDPSVARTAAAALVHEHGPGCDHGHDDGDHKDHAHAGHGHDHAGETSSSHAGHGHSHGDTGGAKVWWKSRSGMGAILALATWVIAAGLSQAMPDFSRWFFSIAALIAIAPVAWRALAAMRGGVPVPIELLVTVAGIGALFIDAAFEAALVAFLFLIGEVIEGVSADRARQSIKALGDLMPKTAMKLVSGQLVETPAAMLLAGDVIEIRPGDRVAADGVAVAGTPVVDQSPVTGESIPVTKTADEEIFAGSINAGEAFRMTVSRASDDNTVARIIRLVEEAEANKAPIARFIDRFSLWYTPAAAVAAILTFVVPVFLFQADMATWTYRALALLLIACPCALVLSTPAAITAGIAAGARRGILIKGGGALERIGSVKTIAFDKTGTLTEGKPKVTDVAALSVERKVLLSVAASIEQSSSHPLAKAVMALAAQEGVKPLPASKAWAEPGNGAFALIGGDTCIAASPRYLAAKGLLLGEAAKTAETLENEGKTVIGIARGEVLIGLIALRDEPRPEAAAAIAALRRSNVGAVMLTGDNRRTGSAIAKTLGLDVKAELMPKDKIAAIADLKVHGGVAMVGDGINDAPALAAATVGIAMGKGSDVALETADAALIGDRIEGVAEMVALSRATMANIRQNIVFAIGLKVFFLVTSLTGYTGLLWAVLADTGGTVIVTLNALRLLRFGRTR